MTRIIVIDDEERICILFKMALERAGYEVDVAANGVEGINLQHKNPAQLIITDLVMPEKEGIETIIDLRRDFPKVKIIAVSGGGRITPDSYLNTAGILGADRTFKKPVNLEELIKAVRQILEEQESKGGDGS